MKNLTKFIFAKVTYVTIIGIFILIAGCQKELTSKAVEKDIEKARKATEKAQQRAQAAVNSRKQLYMQTRQERIDQLESRVDQIDGRLASLGNISSSSPNKAAVADVNGAIYEFKSEKDSVQRAISQFKSVAVPNWDASLKGIKQSVDRIEDELNMLEKTLQNQKE